MKKIIIIIAVLMVLGTHSYASPVSQQWIKTYGGNEADIIHCIQQTMDGGYIAVGFSESFAPGWIIDLLILKLDVNGNVSWQKTYRYGDDNFANSIRQTTDGGYIVAGYTSGGIFVKGWVLKLNGKGDILWQKTYNEVVQFKSIQLTTDGGYIVTGDCLNGDSGEIIVIVKLNSTGDVTWAKKYTLAYYEGANTVLQTVDGGYVLNVQASLTGYYSICILKLDNDGNIIWQKSYGNETSSIAHSIQQTGDGGYIAAGATEGKAMVVKLDSDGGIVWQKVYGSVDVANSILQNIDGGYEVVGSGFNEYNVIIFSLDSNGNIVRQKEIGGGDWDVGVYCNKTADGGSIVAGNTASFGAGNGDFMMLKIDSIGDIPGCDIMTTYHAGISNANMTSQDTNATVESFPITITDTDIIPQDILVDTSILCYYEDPNDIDGDGVEYSLGGAMAGSMYRSSFLAEGDNCSDMPNGPYLGACTSGKVGSTCIAHAACGDNGFCSMAQEDTYPPLGNGIGDACDCEGDFSCDGDVDGSDASTFKADFGRSAMTEPCIAGNTCNGDFNCDGDADGSDASLFKSDFGRSSMQNPCPLCATGMQWCSYPLP